MSKRSGKARSDIVIKANNTSFRILEVGQNGIRTELCNRGTITGKYRGTHWDTLETQLNQDGTSSWQVKFMQVTDKGEMLVGTGSGTGEAPDKKGIAKLMGKGTHMTVSERLGGLTGNGWICEVDNYVASGMAVIAVNFK
jgi:hypothetical protein